jgi:hypothetical protein
MALMLLVDIQMWRRWNEVFKCRHRLFLHCLYTEPFDSISRLFIPEETGAKEVR